MARVIFYPNLAFGKLELIDPSRGGGRVADAPSWLLDRPDVLEAMLILAKDGGSARLGRAPDWEDVVIDTETGAVVFVPGAD